MATLPYITAPGNIEKALLAIKTAATPPRVNQDFVKTILQIKGGSGNQVTSFLRKIGFSNADGSPTEIYTKFRNSSSSSQSIIKALKIGYAPLYARNEYMHQLSDDKLKGIIIEETGQSEDSSVVSLVLTAIKSLKKFIDLSKKAEEETELNNNTHEDHALPAPPASNQNFNKQQGITTPKSMGLNLSYTINLNLPATSDIAVFNAIFKSLKENLLENSSDE